jgi:polyisoprenoid-binding protein YceI
MLKWSVDKSHSNVKLTVDHLVISEVDGHFSDYTVEAETMQKMNY